MDAEGNEYLDFVGGIAVNALGTAHPAVVRAVSEQITSLGHVSNLFIAEPPVALADGCWHWPDVPGASTSATPVPRPSKRRSRSAG